MTEPTDSPRAARRSPPAADGGAVPGAWLHASLAVSDLDAACGFLVGALGFGIDLEGSDLTDEVARLTARPGLTARLVQLSRPGDGCRIELIEFRDGDATPPDAAAGGVPRAHLAFAVADLDAARRALAAAGAVPLGEVVAFAEGRCVYLRAPGGLVVELEETGATGAAPLPAGAPP